MDEVNKLRSYINSIDFSELITGDILHEINKMLNNIEKKINHG